MSPGNFFSDSRVRGIRILDVYIENTKRYQLSYKTLDIIGQLKEFEEVIRLDGERNNWKRGERHEK